MPFHFSETKVGILKVSERQWSSGSEFIVYGRWAATKSKKTPKSPSESEANSFCKAGCFQWIFKTHFKISESQHHQKNNLCRGESTCLPHGLGNICYKHPLPRTERQQDYYMMLSSSLPQLCLNLAQPQNREMQTCSLALHTCFHSK